MPRKNQSLTAYLYVEDISSGLPKTGDAANLSIRVSKDGGASAAASNSPAEVDATNMPGLYRIALTPSETNANVIVIAGKSSSANTLVSPTQIPLEDYDLASAIATAVWNAGARSLTTFGTLTADAATAVWGAASRTLSAFAFTPTVGSLAAQAKADVNAEVVDALSVDTYAEPSAGSPPATASLAAKLGYLYTRMRNRKAFNKSTGVETVFGDNNSTALFTSTASSDGTTTTKAKAA